MGRFLGGIVLPLLLLTAALLNWSLISLANLLAFLFILLSAPPPTIGFRCWRWTLISNYVITFSLLVIISHAIFHIIISVEGEQWRPSDAQWAKLFGFIRDESQMSPYLIYFLVLQLLAAVVALADIYWSRFVPDLSRYSSLQHLLTSFEQIASHLRVVSCLLLPAVQLVAGISHPSWVSLPFFICSCIGLVDWSLTRNFIGLFRLEHNYPVHVSASH